MFRYLYFAILLAVFSRAMAQEPIDVWPDLAPGETTREVGEKMQPRDGELPSITRIIQITRPTMTFHPAKVPNGTAVIILPGGGFGRVVTDLEGTEAADWLNRNGVSAFVLSYRTTADSNRPGWVKPLQDAQRALSLIRNQADRLGIQKDRIGLLGFSAGGQVAARLLCDQDKKTYEQVDSMDSISHRPDFSILVYPWNMYDAAKENLIDGVQDPRGCPPTYIVHTDDDRSTSLGAVLFYAGLKKFSIPSELHVYGNGGHGYGLRTVAGSQISTWPEHAAHWLATRGFLSSREPVKQVWAAPGSIVAKIAADADRVSATVQNDWVKKWLATASRLPPVEPKQIKVNDKAVDVDESLFYYSRYGSPLAYARALDLACQAGFEPKPGSRFFDFGYGSIGPLRMFALNGYHAIGVDVAPLLKAMYSDASGPLGDGSVQVFDGRFPSEPELVEKIGRDFDLVLSKNVLKRGYIHPTREVSDPRMTIELGVDDPTFLANVHKMLKPGGLFVIYNFCPPKSKIEEAYVPWAEGESPFTREMYAAAGLEVLSFDVVDDQAGRELAIALGWDKDGMKVESELFAWYTIARK